MARLARETGLTREGLCKALSADGNPSLGTVLASAPYQGREHYLLVGFDATY